MVQMLPAVVADDVQPLLIRRGVQHGVERYAKTLVRVRVRVRVVG
jgi:hypothetical protein